MMISAMSVLNSGSTLTEMMIMEVGKPVSSTHVELHMD
jgi:hypothetical protein